MSTLSTLISAKLSPFSPAALAPSYVNNEFITLPHSTSLMNNATCCLTVGEAATFTTSFTYCQLNGQCCLFTVPAGVTDVQFQIWGGGGASQSCQHGTCCSFSPPGGSGEYTYVRMRVTAGQTYTLCAGGACQSGGCNNTLPGCNSFVCGSNSTCIVSCGGFSCGSVMQFFGCYPQALESSWCGPGNMQNFVSPASAAAVTPFLKPAMRSIMTCACCQPDIITSSNSITMTAKVPSILGSVLQCGTNICNMNYIVPAIMCDHSIQLRCSGWVGFSDSVGGYGASIAMDNAPAFNFPGAGGPATLSACYCGQSVCGHRARSGLILVRMR